MSETIMLEAQPRTVTGKKVKQLRADDLIPCVIYGAKLDKAVHIQVPRRILKDALKAAGGSNLIELTIGDETHNVLVRDVQRDILKGTLVHVDFYAVRMDVKISTEVPISLEGQVELVKSGEAMLITRSNTIEVECFPNNIPSEIVLDISKLVEIGDYLTVADVEVPEGVTILADPDEVLVRTDYAESLEEEEEELEEELLGTEFDAEGVEVIQRGKEEEEEEEF